MTFLCAVIGNSAIAVPLMIYFHLFLLSFFFPLEGIHFVALTSKRYFHQWSFTILYPRMFCVVSWVNNTVDGCVSICGAFISFSLYYVVSFYKPI